MDSGFSSSKPALKDICETIREIWLLDDMKKFLNFFLAVKWYFDYNKDSCPGLSVVHAEVWLGNMLRNAERQGKNYMYGRCVWWMYERDRIGQRLLIVELENVSNFTYVLLYFYVCVKISGVKSKNQRTTQG